MVTDWSDVFTKRERESEKVAHWNGQTKQQELRFGKWYGKFTGFSAMQMVSAEETWLSGGLEVLNKNRISLRKRCAYAS